MSSRTPIKRVSIALLVLLVFASAVGWLAFKSDTGRVATAGAITSSSLSGQQPVPPVRGSKEQAMSAALGVLNQQPITFFGRVVDQAGKPVGEVNVTGLVMVQKKWMEGHIEKYPTRTNADGLFSFHGISGRDISFWFEKAGYRYDNRRQKSLFKYALMSRPEERHQPNERAPVTFVIWKEHPQEPVLKWEIRSARIPASGEPAHFDLINGKAVSSGGDLVVTMTRTPLHIQRGQRFDWSITFSSPDGGIAQLEGPYSNEAPDAGYEESFRLDFPRDRADWESSMTRSFYLKSRGGAAFARVTVMIFADNEPPPVAALVVAYVNPNGSRNLEFAGDRTGPPPRD